MNLIYGQCLICKQKEQVLQTAQVRPFLKYIINTYFVNNKIGIKELKYRISPKSLCVVCACNVETSYKFKKTYENKVNKEIVVKKSLSCCVVCGFRGFGLVKTEDNPNQFDENVRLFMETISKPRLYKQCAVCFVCVLELQNFNKINAVLQEEIELTNNKIEEIVLSEDEDLKVLPLMRGIVKRQHSSTKNLNLRSKRKRTNSISPDEDIPSAKLPKVHLSKQYFKNSPNVKSVQTLRQIEKINIPTPVIRDKKMFSDLPYIEMKKVNSDIIERNATGKYFNTIDHNDISETSIAADSTITDLSDYQKPKISIKIKFLSKKRKPCPKSKKNLNKCGECKKVFTTLCQLKSHLLWHEKPGCFKVNLIRDKIISELIMKSQKIKSANVVEQEKENPGEAEKTADEKVEGGENVEVIEDNLELIEINDNGICTSPLNNVKDSVETDNIHHEVNGMTDKNKNKDDQEEVKSANEKEEEELDTILDVLDDFNEDEYVIVDEITVDSDKKENHKDDENKTEVNINQQSEGNEIVEDRVGEDNKEKENGEVEKPVEKSNKVTDEENKTDENSQINSEETNEEYHDANEEIILNFSESDKCSEKSLSHKQSNENSSEEHHIDLEESEERSEKHQELQEKTSEDISDEDNVKTRELESTIERNLRMILGDEEDEIVPSNSKEESLWDEACSEKEIFDLSTLNNTILKKTTRKSLEESPKTMKKVRFIDDNDVEEESNEKNKIFDTAMEVEISSEKVILLNKK